MAIHHLGLHTTALAVDDFSNQYSQIGMKLTVKLSNNQKSKRCGSCQTSKWSGATYIDGLLKMVSGGVTSTAAMGQGVTEDQFKESKAKA